MGRWEPHYSCAEAVGEWEPSLAGALDQARTLQPRGIGASTALNCGDLLPPALVGRLQLVCACSSSKVKGRDWQPHAVGHCMQVDGLWDKLVSIGEYIKVGAHAGQ